MTLRAVVENLDAVDKAFHTEYRPEMDQDGKETGKYLLDVEAVGGVELRDTSGFKSTMDAERHAAKQAKAALKKFEGIDPVQVAAQAQELEELKAADPDREAAVAELVDQRVEAFKVTSAAQMEAYKVGVTKDKEAFSERNSHLEKLLSTSLVDDKAMSMARQISDTPELLAPHIKTRLRADTEGDKGKTVIVDVNGTPRMGSDFKSDMTEKELLEEISKDPSFAVLIRGSDSSGGAPKPAQKTFGKTAAKFDKDASITDRVASMRKKLGVG